MNKLAMLYSLKVPEGMNIPRIAPFINMQIDKVMNRVVQQLVPLEWALNTTPRAERVVVSLTSFPARISAVSRTILTIFSQTVKPDRIVLWLASSQFANHEIPQSLHELTKYGLDIRFCNADLLGHKKYYYAMQEEEDSIIITVDDDLIYPENMVERLLEKHAIFPNAVISMRGKEMIFSDGTLISYNKWPTLSGEGVLQPNHKIMASTGAGTLYPPHVIPREAFNKSAIMECALHADDLWMKFMELLGGIKVLKVSSRTRPFAVIADSQVDCLNTINVLGGNDKCIAKLLQKYPQVYEILNTMGGSYQDGK